MSRPSPRSLVLPEMFGSKAPAVPTVSIDDSLGVAPEAVGFDFDLFYDLARTVGYRRDEISTHAQHFSGLAPRSYIGKHRGRTATIFVPRALEEAERIARGGREYVAKTYGADIFTDPTPAGVINEGAIHELGHDHDNLHLGGKRSGRIDAIRWIVPRVATFACMGDVFAQRVMGEWGVHVAAPFVAMIAAGAIALRQDFGPRANRPSESVAYNFQEQYGHLRIVDFYL